LPVTAEEAVAARNHNGGTQRRHYREEHRSRTALKTKGERGARQGQVTWGAGNKNGPKKELRKPVAQNELIIKIKLGNRSVEDGSAVIRQN